VTDALYTLDELLAATGGRAVGLTEPGIGSISIDSRELGPHALFVAIKGDRFDGHDFVDQALANGAVAALVSAGRLDETGRRLIAVPDALEGLAALGRAARARTSARIAAVTGSVGKTTTKEALRTICAAAGSTHASIKSFNNHWGVPLMLARMPRATEFGVFEIGMSAPGEITPLTAMVRPHVALVTTVAPAHLEFFNSVAEIAAAKAEIFTGIEPGGTAIVNADHEHVDLLLDHARQAGVGEVLTYGFSPRAQLRITDVDTSGSASRANVDLPSGCVTLALNLAGRHMLANAAGALIVAERLGVPVDLALAALGRFEAPEGRGAVVRLGRDGEQLLLVDESYNANPASMRAALEVFAGQSAPRGRRVLVLGDMLELGATSPDLHAALAPAVTAAGADLVFLVGPHMAALRDALGSAAVAGHAQSSDALVDVIVKILAPGDAVMVKGSNGVRLGKLVTALRERFA